MATYGLDVECPHIFYGTHFARWKNWMTCNFKFICPRMWWMVDVGFSHVLDEGNLTPTQEKCLDLDIQATNILFRSLHNCILGEIMDKETALEIWSYLNEKYRAASDDHDDYKKAQANYEKQGNEKHQMSKKEKAQQKRRCYLCRERGHMAYSCPLGNNSKLISIDANIVLRKDGNSNSFVTIENIPLFILRHYISMLLLT